MDPLTYYLLVTSGVSLLSSLVNVTNQRSMLNDQQDFNSAEAEKARDWSSEGARYDRMTSLGFNPNLVAASIMGNAQSVPYAASSPTAPQVPDMMSGLQKLLTNMPGVSVEDKKVDAEARHMNLLYDLIEFENGFLPITMQQQIDYWNEYIDGLKKDNSIKDYEIKRLDAYAPYLKPIAAQEYLQSIGNTSRIFAEAEKFFAEAQVNYADVDLKKVMQSWYRSEIGLNYRRGRLLFAQEQTEYQKAFELETQANLNIANQGLVKAQTEVAENQAMLTFQQAFDQFMDNQLKSGGEISIVGDVMRDLVIMDLTEDGEGKRLCNSILKGQRTLYDNQIESRWQNYGHEFLMNLGDEVPGLLRGFIPISHYNIGRKTSNQSHTTKGSSAPSKPAVNQTVVKDGHKIRVDSHGTKWIDGHPQ